MVTSLFAVMSVVMVLMCLGVMIIFVITCFFVIVFGLVKIGMTMVKAAVTIMKVKKAEVMVIHY